MNQRDREAFLDELREAGPALLRLASALGFVAFSAMWFVDPFLASGSDLQGARTVRVLSCSVLAALFAASFAGDLGKRQVRPLSMAAFVTTGLSVIALTHFTGGAASTYHEALYLTMFGYGMLPLPWRRFDALVLYLGTVTTYIGVMLAGGRPSPTGALPTHAALLLLAVLIAGVMNDYMMGSRRSDFQARLELAKANEQLMVLDQAKSRFFANLSHELRTPLTLTMAPIDALLESSREPLSDGQREKLELAQRNALRLLRQVDDLLALTRAEASALRLHVSDVDLVGMLRTLAADIAELARRKRLHLEVVADAGLPTVQADGELIERVLLNVIGNAAKFVKEGGRIVLGARREGDGVAITVQDDGIGIRAEDLPHIFDRFYQVDSGSKRSFGGTGIGLALARELMELHGGTIRAESTPGVGTTLICWLPITLPASVAHDPALVHARDDSSTGLPEWHDAIRSASSYRYQGIADATERRIAPRPRPKSELPTILVVEDNPDMIRLISALLGHDYNVHSATDGATGLRYARDRRPDLIISDVMMPVMDGFEMARELRASPLTSQIPLMFLTARGALHDRVEGHGIGAEQYLAKPFRNEELLAQVEALLSRQRTVRGAERARQDEAIVFMASGVAEALARPIGALDAARRAASPEQTPALDAATDAIADMVRVLGELTHAAATPVDVPADPATVLAGVVASFSAGLGDHHPALHLAVDKSAPVGMGADELGQVVSTLVCRALRVTPAGRNVFVSTRHVVDGTLSITVTDEGPTLSPDQLERLFFPFNDASAAAAGGLRAGLAMLEASHLVARRGGTLHVEPTGTGGLAISVRLPIAQGAA